MSPRTENQFKKIREQRKAHIMEVALELFAEKGFRDTPISLIAEKAKISKGLMYNYFSSKEELITEIITSGMEILMKVFDPNHDGILTEDEFDYFIHESFCYFRENLQFWKLYFVVLTQPMVFEMVQDKIMEVIMPVLKVLEEYYRSRGHEEPEAEARLLGAVLDGVTLNYLVDPEHFPLEKIEKLIIKRFK